MRRKTINTKNYSVWGLVYTPTGEIMQTSPFWLKCKRNAFINDLRARSITPNANLKVQRVRLTAEVRA